MIYKYSQWLEESEKTPPVPAAEPAPQEEPDLTPAQMEAPVEPSEPEQSEPTETDIEGQDETTDVGKFRKLDQERKASIKAFKEKQAEFLEMPDDMRKNPQSDEDMERVENLKSELINLNTAMKAAVSAFDKFNDELLGIDNEEEDVEP